MTPEAAQKLINGCLMQVAWYRNGRRMTGYIHGRDAVFVRSGRAWVKVEREGRIYRLQPEQFCEFA